MINIANWSSKLGDYLRFRQKKSSSKPPKNSKNVIKVFEVVFFQFFFKTRLRKSNVLKRVKTAFIFLVCFARRLPTKKANETQKKRPPYEEKTRMNFRKRFSTIYSKKKENNATHADWAELDSHEGIGSFLKPGIVIKSYQTTHKLFAQTHSNFSCRGKILASRLEIKNPKKMVRTFTFAFQISIRFSNFPFDFPISIRFSRFLPIPSHSKFQFSIRFQLFPFDLWLFAFQFSLFPFDFAIFRLIFPKFNSFSGFFFLIF